MEGIRQPQNTGFIFKYRGEFKPQTSSMTPIRVMYNALVLHFGMRPESAIGEDGKPNEEAIRMMFQAYKSFEPQTEICQIEVSEATGHPVMGYVGTLNGQPDIISFCETEFHSVVNMMQACGLEVPEVPDEIVWRWWRQITAHAAERGDLIDVVPATFKVIG